MAIFYESIRINYDAGGALILGAPTRGILMYCTLMGVLNSLSLAGFHRCRF
jgi:hypothetical protein